MGESVPGASLRFGAGEACPGAAAWSGLGRQVVTRTRGGSGGGGGERDAGSPSFECTG